MSTEVIQPMPDTMYSRVLSYPMVSTAIDQMANVYNMSKEKSGLVRCTFEVAEKSVALAAATAKPVVDRCEKPISFVNNYGCKQLDKLEEKVPIITEPSEKVFSKVKNETMKAFDSGKERSTAYVNGLADTRVGSLVTSSMKTALSATEYAVDYYLPSDEEKDSDVEEEETNDDEVVVARPPHSIVVEEQPGSINRVTTLSSKVRRRLYQRAIKRVHSIQKRSQETIASLHFTVDLIDYAKNNIDSANENVRNNVRNTQEQLWKTWNDWTTENETEDVHNEETSEDETNQAEAAEMKTMKIARTLSKRLRVLSGNLATSVSMMPQNIRTKVNEGREIADSLFHTLEEVQYFRDIPTNVISLARQHLNSLQDLTLDVGDYLLSVRPIQWLVPQQVRTEEQETELTMDDVLPEKESGEKVEKGDVVDDDDEDEAKNEVEENKEDSDEYFEEISEGSDTEL